MSRNPYRYVPLPGRTARSSPVVKSVTVRRFIFALSLILATVFGGLGGFFLSLLILALVGHVFYGRNKPAKVKVDPNKPYGD